MFLLGLAQAPSVLAGQVVIANLNVPETRLSRNQARLIYTQRRSQWSDGSPVRVFVLADDAPEHKQFVKDRLGLYPRQLRRVWDRLTYSGTGQAPQQVESVDEMLQRVSSTPGGVGYLSDQAVRSSVQVLEVTQ